MGVYSFGKGSYSSGGRRVGAYVADQVAMTFVQSGGLLLGSIVAGLMVSQEMSKEVQNQAVVNGMVLGWIFWGLVAWFINYGVLQGLTGATVGKMIFSIRVVKEDAQPIGIVKSMARTIAYYASALPFGIGFVALVWSKKSQCWHDVICNTFVINKESALAKVENSGNKDQLEFFGETRKAA